MSMSRGEITYFNKRKPQSKTQHKIIIQWEKESEPQMARIDVPTNSTATHKLLKVKLTSEMLNGCKCFIKGSKSNNDIFISNETAVLEKLLTWTEKEEEDDILNCIVELMGSGYHKQLGKILCVKAYQALNAREYIKQKTNGQGLGEEKAKNVVIKMVKTIEYMHKKGVIHRDLKPENILLLEKNDGSINPVFIDFGHAIVINENEKHRTDRNRNIGNDANVNELFGFSAGYGAAEQLLSRIVHKKSDIYGLAYTILWIVCGFDISRVEIPKEINQAIDETLYTGLRRAQRIAQILIDYPQLSLPWEQLNVTLFFQEFIEDMTKHNVLWRKSAEHCLVATWVSTLPVAVKIKYIDHSPDMSLQNYYKLFKYIELKYNSLVDAIKSFNNSLGRSGGTSLKNVKAQQFRVAMCERVATISKRHKGKVIVDLGVTTLGTFVCVEGIKEVCHKNDSRDSAIIPMIQGTPFARAKKHTSCKPHDAANRRCGKSCSKLHKLSGMTKLEIEKVQQLCKLLDCVFLNGCPLSSDKCKIYDTFIEYGKVEALKELSTFNDHEDETFEKDEERKIEYVLIIKINDDSKQDKIDISNCKHIMSNEFITCQKLMSKNDTGKEEKEEKKEDEIIAIDLKCCECGIDKFSHLAHVYLCNLCNDICCCYCYGTKFKNK